MQLKLAYSPDADDAFMFRAAVENLIDTEGLVFVPYTNDTQSLNEVAQAAEIDITAISVAQYPFIADKYAILGHGGSVGNNYGPVIVSKNKFEIKELEGKKIATPGLRTTAHFVTNLIIENANFHVVPITPYQAIFDSILNDEVDAGIIIHEGRLTYQKYGLHKICDIGKWWFEKYKLPLPLGANVIKRSLGKTVIEKASRVLQNSIRYALDNKQDMIDFLIKFINRPEDISEKKLLDKYLDMYANEETFRYSESSKQAFILMYNLMYEKKIIPTKLSLTFA